MEKQAYIIAGLDAFGLTIVQTLAKTDVDLLVIDRNSKRLEDVAEKVIIPDLAMGIRVANQIAEGSGGQS